MTNLRVKFHSFGSSTIRYYAVYDLVVLGDCIYDVDITAPYEEVKFNRHLISLSEEEKYILLHSL